MQHLAERVQPKAWHRREVLALLGLSGAVGCVGRLRQPSPAPPLWLVERGRGRVYLFGIAGALDRAWFTPAVDRAFSDSSEIWLENAPAPSPDAAPDPKILQAINEMTQDRNRTFYDALQPAVRVRAQAYVRDLGIDPRTIEHARPWWAYFTINTAFWQKHPPARATENVDQVLVERARGAGKLLRYEFETPLVTFRFFSAMSDEVQSQFVEMLLDFLDDEQHGRNDAAFEWTKGMPSTRALDRMRAKTPALYRVIQVDRNAWWARNIDQLLGRGGHSFVIIGINHILGPDSIQAQLRRLRIATATDVGASPGRGG